MAWVRRPIWAVLGFGIGGPIVYLGVDRLGLIIVNTSLWNTVLFMSAWGVSGLALGVLLNRRSKPY